MPRTESFRALRRANPRVQDGFHETVERWTQVVPTPSDVASDTAAQRRRPRAVARISFAGAAIAILGIALAALTVGSPAGGPGVEDAAAAVQRAATATAASAEVSGTADVRITHAGELWAGTRIRWNGEDLAVSREGSRRGGLIVVGGMMYGVDPLEGGWFELGSPASIDPDSGTTPSEYLAAVREDVGGATLRRLTRGATFTASEQLAEGSMVYAGTVAAGNVAREAGFKGGQAIRVLPFGFVAHGAAADPSTPLDVALTVGADEFLRSVVASWGSWRFEVRYSGLGATPAPVAPDDAKPFCRRIPPSACVAQRVETARHASGVASSALEQVMRRPR